MYDPYVISNGTDNITPHITIGYRKSAYVPETKIPHNLNGEVHLTQEDKERIRQLSNLSEVVLAEEQYLIKQVDTSTASEYAKTGNDIICAFVIKPNEYIGDKLLSFTHNGISGGNTTYRIQNKWLQADCFDAKNNLIKTFLSKNSASESSSYVTHWEFENFEILDTYNTIEFRLSNSGTTRQTVYINMKGSSLQSSNNTRILYKEGWITKWAEGQNVNNIVNNSFTANFTLNFEPKMIKGAKFIEHMGDKNQHFTEVDREKFQGLISQVSTFDENFS
jgi:hypothetical protein